MHGFSSLYFQFSMLSHTCNSFKNYQTMSEIIWTRQFMELTISDALEKGIEAHKAGNLNEAELFYKAILRKQPDNPDANHNMGVLAKSIGQPEKAEQLFKKAIETNPNVSQFWISLVDLLITLKRFDEVQKSIDHAKDMKVTKVVLNQLKRRANLDKGSQKVIDNAQEPSLNQIDKLNKFYQEEKFQLALEEINKLKQIFPSSAILSNFCGLINLALKNYIEASTNFKKAIMINPNFAEAFNSLGIVNNNFKDPTSALENFSRAVQLKPDYADAHYNMGVMYHEIEHLEDAIECYKRALISKPEYLKARINFGVALKAIEFIKPRPDLHQIIEKTLFKGSVVRPRDISKAVLSLIAAEAEVKKLFNSNTGLQSFKDLKKVADTLKSFQLLHSFMRVCSVPNLNFEKIFKETRQYLLYNLEHISESSSLCYYFESLAIQCFVNEYLYSESTQEMDYINLLSEKVRKILESHKQPPTLQILCLACYRPLHNFDWATKLKQSDNLTELLKKTVEEPELEKRLIPKIKILSSIKDPVSVRVREQYEHNPYPRWMNIGLRSQPIQIGMVKDEANLKLQLRAFDKKSDLKILVAGCGTGQHSIDTASRFKNCHVTAIDLSLSSLAFAKRKSDELGLSNIEYLQADIIDLENMDKSFDIIESLGVLHHMHSPQKGWKVLRNILVRGGLMKIGLYSELARQHITHFRNSIVTASSDKSKNFIRNFREEMIVSDKSEFQLAKSSSDFYSLSGVKDLLFHEQEHLYTIPQIIEELQELKLNFCGFENSDLCREFVKYYTENSDLYDLKKWHEFETSHPRIFSGMYQFWCQDSS